MQTGCSDIIVTHIVRKHSVQKAYIIVILKNYNENIVGENINHVVESLLVLFPSDSLKRERDGKCLDERNK